MIKKYHTTLKNNLIFAIFFIKPVEYGIGMSKIIVE